MDQAGIVCFHCGAGVFMHRRFWRYQTCEVCQGACCSECRWTGVFATPLPDGDLDLVALRLAWADAVRRATFYGQDVPAVMLPFLDPDKWLGAR